MENNREALYH